MMGCNPCRGNTSLACSAGCQIKDCMRKSLSRRNGYVTVGLPMQEVFNPAPALLKSEETMPSPGSFALHNCQRD